MYSSYCGHKIFPTKDISIAQIKVDASLFRQGANTVFSSVIKHHFRE